ncbi:hypothetical protein FC98_GL002158 [Lentilactobacillus kisonensis DSM 19906 = JCM 15041]|uniref:DUF3784 domain-containing protein n=2 Tax=Lentilactobacillus kisonensis TaxID=481722 RepID=A0A0R1NH34_9LACO|nr:hypothetical protein FC98_GL002158 [Lentilactobacillus kisonensis DSM 19906 = JCM 15041]
MKEENIDMNSIESIILIVLIVAWGIYMVDPTHKVSRWVGYRSEGTRTSLVNWKRAQKMFYGISIPFFAVLVLINYFIPLSNLVAAFIIVGWAVAIMIIIEIHLG